MLVDKFEIDLKKHHDESGKTAYRVAKETGLFINTVKRYISGTVIVGRLETAVVTLAEYYHVSLSDVVKVVKVNQKERVMRKKDANV